MSDKIDNDAFEVVVLGSREPTLVDFYADWCPPCRVMGPTLDAIQPHLN